MIPISVFRRIAPTVLLIAGIFLVVLLASPAVQAEATSPSSEMKAIDEASHMLIAVEKEGKKPPPKNVPCEGPPGTCYGTSALDSPDATGCTSGNKCTAEGMTCSVGKKCKTMGAPGPCYCACM